MADSSAQGACEDFLLLRERAESCSAPSPSPGDDSQPLGIVNSVGQKRLNEETKEEMK